jgi:hypothetical protein
MSSETFLEEDLSDDATVDPVSSLDIPLKLRTNGIDRSNFGPLLEITIQFFWL